MSILPNLNGYFPVICVQICGQIYETVYIYKERKMCKKLITPIPNISPRHASLLQTRLHTNHFPPHELGKITPCADAPSRDVSYYAI